MSQTMKWTLLALMFLLPGFATAQTINRIAAVVNSEIITTHQLEQALGQQPAARPGSPTDDLSDQVLERLIEEKLLAQRISHLGIKVTEAEINAAIEDVKISNNLDQDGLEAALAAQGMTLSSYREQIRTEILRYKLLAQEVSHRVAVTSSEIREYFQANIDQYDIRSYLYVSRISFPLAAEGNSEQIYEQALISRKRLLAGEEFSKVLADVADIATGDIMGELVLGDLAEPLQLALRDLAAGEVSEPVELNRQLHLFIVTDQRSGKEAEFERVRKSIEEHLKRQKTELRFAEWEQELRAGAYIDKRI